MPSALSDLLHCARTGDIPSRILLLEQLRDRLQLFLTRLLQQQPDLQSRVGASDILQQTLIRANDHFCDFLGTTSAEVLAWLRKIARNELRQEVRKHCLTRKRQVARQFSLHPDELGKVPVIASDAPTPAEELIRREELDLLREGIAALDPDSACIIRLRTDGMCFGEIGRALGVSEGAATMRYARAIQKLETWLQAQLR
jgi:RNA polymerase sigma-70 factor (ECF subfamily)